MNNNVREPPDRKLAGAVLRACALNGWIEPGARPAPARPPSDPKWIGPPLSVRRVDRPRNAIVFSCCWTCNLIIGGGKARELRVVPATRHSASCPTPTTREPFALYRLCHLLKPDRRL